MRIERFAASLLYKYRYAFLAGWGVLFLCLAYFAYQLPDKLRGSGFDMHSSHRKVELSQWNDFHYPKSSAVIYFSSPSLTPHEQHYKKKVTETLKALKQMPYVQQIESPYERPYERIEGHSAYAVIGFSEAYGDTKDTIPRIKKKLRSYQNESISIQITGQPVFGEDMNEASKDDLLVAEAIGIPAALIILILAFRGVVSALIPIVTGLFSVICSFGILYTLTDQLVLPVFILNVVPMIGLALGIDFSLLIVSRFRKEGIHKGMVEALSATLQTSGRAVLVSGICVWTGLLAMLFFKIDVFKAVSIGGMVVVLISVLNALTFLPPLLCVLRPYLDRLQLLKKRSEETSVIWKKFAVFVNKHPRKIFITTGTILLLGIIPVKDLTLNIPQAEALPASYESRKAFEEYEKVFGQQLLYPAVILFESKQNLTDKKIWNELQKKIAEIEQNIHVAKTVSILNIASQPEELKNRSNKEISSLFQHKKTLVLVYFIDNPLSDEKQDWVQKMDQTTSGALTLTVGGMTKYQQEMLDEIRHKAPFALAFVTGFTYFILLAAFRSLLLPVKAIFMNLLSLLSASGLLIWIYHSGLYVEPAEIGIMVPVFALSLVFGLSMDYEVFLLSKIHEEYNQTGDNDSAVLKGLTETSAIITSAGLIMMVITGAFAFTEVLPIKQIGLAIFIAILIDGTFVRLLLVPSFMKLMGKWNWYLPSFKKKRLRSKDTYQTTT